jgi:hypothetical protein
VTLLLASLLDAAEADESAAAGLVGRHAFADVFFYGKVDVGLEFCFEVGVSLLLMEEGEDAVHSFAGGCHLGVSFGSHGEDSAHDSGEPVPVGGVFRPLPAACAGDGVVLRFAIVVGRTPLGRDPTALLESDEGCVDCALIEEDLVAAGFLDSAGYAVAMQRAYGG